MFRPRIKAAVNLMNVKRRPKQNESENVTKEKLAPNDEKFNKTSTGINKDIPNNENNIINSESFADDLILANNLKKVIEKSNQNEDPVESRDSALNTPEKTDNTVEDKPEEKYLSNNIVLLDNQSIKSESCLENLFSKSNTNALPLNLNSTNDMKHGTNRTNLIKETCNVTKVLGSQKEIGVYLSTTENNSVIKTPTKIVSTTAKIEAEKGFYESSVATSEIKNQGEINGNTSACQEFQSFNSISGNEYQQRIKDREFFKCPQNVENSRGNNRINTDENSNKDVEDVLQMDLHNTLNKLPMSPSKIRQRMRPTPHFGKRRNSFVGSGDELSADTINSPQRRERHHSTSNIPLSTLAHIATPPKRERHHSTSFNFSPHSTGHTMSSPSYHGFGQKLISRTRTDSTCSVFSDATTLSKTRRSDVESNPWAAARKDFESRFVNGVVDKSMLRMSDLIYYCPPSKPMEENQNGANIKYEHLTNKELVEDKKIKVDLDDDKSSIMPVPQLKLNENGELILDDKSLEIETTSSVQRRKDLANSSTLILDENSGTNGFYRRPKRTKEWIPSETIKFYRCLQTVGTDFSLMCQLFPNRTRRDLKLKFKKEERCNDRLISKALLYPKIFDIGELRERLESDELKREENERKWKEIIRKEVKIEKKTFENGLKAESTAARVLKDGDSIYQNEDALLANLKEVRKPNKRRKKGEIAAEGKSPAKRQRRAPKKKSTEVEEKPVNIKAEEHNTDATSENNANDTHDEEEQLQKQLAILLPTENVKEAHMNTVDKDLRLSPVHHPSDDIKTIPLINNTNEENIVQVYTSVVVPPRMNSNRTLVNMDDGTLTHLEDDTEEEENETETVDSPTSAAEEPNSMDAKDLDESDIQQILTELSEGSLVIASTLDPSNAFSIVTEIFMVDKETGEMSEDPLDIPQQVVDCIVEFLK